MIKVTDYICNYLARYGVKDIFMISGGGAMHLVDSVGKHPRLRYICPHHEQAAAIAAEGYSRATGKMGVVVVTSGPGGTNTLTGVIGQWLDSVPVLYLSGQVKQETAIESFPGLPLRQIGDQEINIIDIVGPVTKYAVFIKDPHSIRYHLERAIYLATHGRPGPVWLDIPLDVQGALIDEKKLRSYDHGDDEIKFNKIRLKKQVKEVVKMLKRAKRPVLLAGHGIRIAGAEKIFQELIEKSGIPVLTSFCGFDLISSDHKLYAGRPGTIGTRFGNFVLQNADLLLCVGSRNNIRQISYNWKTYASKAKKVVVDIDRAELKKPTVKPDIAVNADAKDFLIQMRREIIKAKLPDWGWWLDWCRERKNRYPVVLKKYWKARKFVDPYCFMETLSKALKKGSLVVTGNGTASVAYFQAGIVKKDQRVIWNSGCAAMGYDLPAAIGVAFGTAGRPVVCIAGDGSLQMNIQELQTMAHNKLPIKLFVLNNRGYVSIKQTQDTFFEGHRVACSPDTGVSFPDIRKVAGAYGIHTERIDGHAGMDIKIAKVLRRKEPIVCEVILNPNQEFMPRLKSEKRSDGSIVSKPLEDMYPFLTSLELRENMIRG